MDKIVVGSSYRLQSSQAPVQQTSPPPEPKNVFGRSLCLAPPTEACSRIDVESRARYGFGVFTLKECAEATNSPLYSESRTPFHQRLMKKTRDTFQNTGVTPADWGKRWQELQDISSSFKSLIEAHDGSSGENIIRAIEQDNVLKAALSDLVARERRGESDAIFQAMILDRRLTTYLELAEYVKPCFDWRSVHSHVKDVIWQTGKKRKAQDPDEPSAEKVSRSTHSQSLNQVPCRPSLQDIRDRAREFEFPEVAYAPTRFYDNGSSLFPIYRSDKQALARFTPTRKQELQNVERRLERSGVTPLLFAAHWCFFCAYSEMLTTSQKQPNADLKRWLATVANSEIKGDDTGRLLSLMLDYLTVIFEHQPERFKHLLQEKPSLDWRGLCRSAQPMSKDEILNTFSIIGEPSDSESHTSSASESHTSSKEDSVPGKVPVDSDDANSKFLEGTWEYEQERIKQFTRLHNEASKGRASYSRKL